VGPGHELWDSDGWLVARFDLAYPAALLAIEYDGAGHGGIGYDDRLRDLRTGALGWHTIRLTAADVFRRRSETLHSIRTQLARRLAEIDTSVVRSAVRPR
jgi:very-short-patch-repair endonuclease